MSATPNSDYMIAKYESPSGDQLLIYNEATGSDEAHLAIAIACPHGDEEGFKMSRVVIPAAMMDQYLDDLAEERGDVCTCGDHDDDEEEGTDG